MPTPSEPCNMFNSFESFLTLDLVTSISPKELLAMSDREICVLNKIVMLEVIKNEEIRKILTYKIQETLKSL